MSSKKYPRIKDYSEIGKRIRQIRGDLPQAVFGNLFGVNQNTVSRWEKGNTLSDEETLNKIANYGGVTVKWLLRGEDIRKTPGPETKYCIRTQEISPEEYNARPVAPLDFPKLIEVLDAVENYYTIHRLKRRSIQKARLIALIYEHCTENKEKPDDILVKRYLPLAD